MQSIRYGEELDFSNENKPVDLIVGRLFDEIKAREPKIREHQAYIEGFPLGNQYEPEESKQFQGMKQLRDMSRNNYAKVIVDAVTSKCGIEGFRSAVSTDEQGDLKIKELFDRDDMGFAIQDAVDLTCTYRRSYLYVDPKTGRQKVLPPTNAAVLVDANNEPAAGIVVTREKAIERDVLRVFVREVDVETGEADGPLYYFIATKEIDDNPLHRASGAISVTGHDWEVPLDGSLTSGWVWWKTVSGVKTDRVPVTILKGKDNKNEFEDAVETMDRINHTIWQRIIVATMQAFRQRAIKGSFPKYDERGNEIQYSELFEPGPSSLWQLPSDAEMWESSTTELGGLLESVRADEKALGAQTKTPMNHFSDSVNNSAEGAASQKEAYYDKIEDRRKRFGSRLRRHVSILMEVNGDSERSSIESLEVIWSPLESLSLSEKTAAFASLKGQGLGVETALREGMKMGPGEIRRAMQEMNKDILRNMMVDSIKQPTPLANAAMNGGQGQALTSAKKSPMINPKGNTSETLVKAAEAGRNANR